MKLTVFLGLLMSICLLPCVEAFGQSNEKKTCEFNIAGIWRTDATSDTNPVFYGFRQNGSVKVLGHVRDALPQNFEVRAMAAYKPASSESKKCFTRMMSTLLMMTWPTKKTMA